MSSHGKTLWSKWIAGICAGLLGIIVLFSGWTLHEINDIVGSHNSELQAILGLEQESTTHHDESTLYLAALCDQTPGCPAQLAHLQTEARLAAAAVQAKDKGKHHAH